MKTAAEKPQVNVSREEYLVLLLECSHLSKVLTGLQVEEQKTLSILSHPNRRHDIQANSRLPKIRLDIAQVSGILKVQTDLINAKIQNTYGIKFQSFKVEDYQAQIEQVQKQEGDLERSEVRQPEGSAPGADAGDASQQHSSSDESGGRVVSISDANNPKR